MWSARILFGCLLAAAAFTGLLGCSKDDPGRLDSLVFSKSDATGQLIRLLDVAGNPIDLWPLQLAPVTVTIFTRTDCPISNRFAPEIRRLYEQYHRRGVEFFLVYVDPREQPEAIRRHLQEYGYPCQAVRDPQHTLVAHCRANVTPEVFVFNPDREMAYSGRINDLYADVGNPRAEATAHELADALDSVLLGQPVAVPRTKAVGCAIADLLD